MLQQLIVHVCLNASKTEELDYSTDPVGFSDILHVAYVLAARVVLWHAVSTGNACAVMRVVSIACSISLQHATAVLASPNPCTTFPIMSI